jgi:hypothetical protein
MKRTQYLTLAVAFAVVPAIACHRNRPENEPGGVETSTRGGEVAPADTSNQTQTGVTDTSGTSTLGPGAEKTQPAPDTVTLKGDTLKGGEPNRAGVPSDTTGMRSDTTGMRSDTTGGGAGQISSDTSKTGAARDTSKTGAPYDTTKPPR